MLQNLAWTKATVNGKKAGLVVFNGNMWLLSYCTAWNESGHINYADVPNHSFFKKMVISSDVEFESFAAWRDNFMRHDESRIVFHSIALPGEDGFNREIRRRTNRTVIANAETPAPATAESETLPEPPSEVVIETPVLESQNDESIDFYLTNYTTANIYQGQNGYHASHARGFMNQPRNSFTGHRIGVELEVEANDNIKHREITDCTSNWFTRERDGSLGGLGVEFITIPLLPEDAKSYATWQPLCNFLKTRAKSWNTGRCGLHVHLGREILGNDENERQMTLGKLLIFYQGDVENWVKATAVFGRERCYHQPDGDTEELKAVKLLGKGVLKDAEVFNKVDTAMKERFGTSRYYAINLTNSATIEFRKGRGSINADRIIAVITMTEAICLFCRETMASDLTLENFQNWLFLNVPCGNPMFRYLNITQADN